MPRRWRAYTLLSVVVVGTLGAPESQAQASTRGNVATSNTTDLINPDRPGIADGSRVIGRDRWQIELGAQYERRRPEPNTRTSTIFAPTLVRFGFADHWEGRIETNAVTSLQTTQPGIPASRATGYAPVSLGAKYQIFDSGSDRRRSLGIIARLFPPIGSANFRNDRFTGDLRLAADWDFAPKLSLNPNIGIGRAQGDAGRTFVAGLGALTLNYLPTDRINPFLDVGIQAPEVPNGRASAILDAGLACIIGRDIQLDLSAGSRAHGSTAPRPFLAIGVSFRG